MFATDGQDNATFEAKKCKPKLKGRTLHILHTICSLVYPLRARRRGIDRESDRIDIFWKGKAERTNLELVSDNNLLQHHKRTDSRGAYAYASPRGYVNPAFLLPLAAGESFTQPFRKKYAFQSRSPSKKRSESVCLFLLFQRILDCKCSRKSEKE